MLFGFAELILAFQNAPEIVVGNGEVVLSGEIQCLLGQGKGFLIVFSGFVVNITGSLSSSSIPLKY